MCNPQHMYVCIVHIVRTYKYSIYVLGVCSEFVQIVYRQAYTYTRVYTRPI
jgi:hypothetical protein